MTDKNALAQGPCPNCKSKSVWVDQGSPIEPNRWFGTCDDCFYSDRTHDTRAEAIAAWNTRTPAPAVEVRRIAATLKRHANINREMGRVVHGQTQNMDEAADMLERLAGPVQQPGDQVERVAKALFDDHWQDDPDLIVCSWEDVAEIEREAWRRSARAAIAAMQPTDTGEG